MQCPRQQLYPTALAPSRLTVGEAVTVSMSSKGAGGRRDSCFEARGGWLSREEELDLEPRLPLSRRGGPQVLMADWAHTREELPPEGHSPALSPSLTPRLLHALGSSRSWLRDAWPAHRDSLQVCGTGSTLISGSLARRGGVVGRPKAWPAPGQAPFVPGQHVSFYSVQVNEHPPNTCCIPCPAPGTTTGTHLRTAQPLSSRSSQAHSTHVLAELRTEIPWMGTPTLKPQLLPGGA